MQGSQVVSGQDGFRFDVVDYEIPPARTTKNAPLMLNQYEDGTPSTKGMKIDLLLRHEDGTPIVGETKVAKVEGYDTDAVLALIQALAGATQFATPSQQERLAVHYRDTLKAMAELGTVRARRTSLSLRGTSRRRLQDGLA